MKKTMNTLDSRGLSFAEWGRFWSNVEKSAGCWNWQAVRHHSTGYGVLRWRGVKAQAHRLSYQITIGTVPTDLYVLHKCDNPVCVRPDHLFLGDQDANMQDRKRKGRYRPKLECKRGHPMVGANVTIQFVKSWNGKRYPCRLCSQCLASKNSRRNRAA